MMETMTMSADKQAADSTAEDDRWAEVAAVERQIRLMAYTSAGDPRLLDQMKMYASWAGQLQKALQPVRKKQNRVRRRGEL